MKPYFNSNLMIGTLPYLQAYMIGPHWFYEIKFFWMLGQFSKNFSSCSYWFYSIQQNILSVYKHFLGLSIICSRSPSWYEVIIILFGLIYVDVLTTNNNIKYVTIEVSKTSIKYRFHLLSAVYLWWQASMQEMFCIGQKTCWS